MPDEELLPGNVGGAARIGDTVHRATGPWTPAVHALLGHLAGRVPCVPRVLGFDEQRREVLDFMPGRVVDGIPAAAAAGDPGMVNLVRGGEPERTRAALDDLVGRIPAIDRSLTLV